MSLHPTNTFTIHAKQKKNTFNSTTKHHAQSILMQNRLGLTRSLKSYNCGGLPFILYTKWFENMDMADAKSAKPKL